MNQQNIVYLILNGTTYGGSEKHTLDLINHLPIDQYAPYLICTEGNPIDKGVTPELSTHVFPISRSPKNFFKIARLIRDLNPDILHLQAARGIATGRYITLYNRLIHRSKYKVISTTHGWILPHFKFVKLVELFFTSFKNIDEITLAVSQKSVDELIKKGFHPQKTKHIYNGIDLSKFDTSRRIRTEVSHIGFVGRLVHQKGVEYFIEMLQHFDQNFTSQDLSDPNFPTFHIYGDGEYREAIEKCIRDLHHIRVTYHGHLAADQITTAYDQIDLLIAPSIDEGLPYTFIEAMNCGIPVIASDVGGVCEIVKQGINGWLIEPKSTQALIHAIKDALEKDISALSENAIETSSHFSLEKMVENTVKCYEQIQRRR